MRQREPRSLARGKAFHKAIQREWPRRGLKSEKAISKPGGRKGRIDIFVDVSGKRDNNLVAIVEIKSTDWDRMPVKNIKCNVSRHASQIWDYIESQIAEGKQISPGVVFRRRPKNDDRLRLIEELFEEKCIAVSWEDESIEQRRAR